MAAALKTLPRPLLVIAAVFGAAFGYVHLLEDLGEALKPGTEAPAFRLPSLAGGEVDLAWHYPLDEFRDVATGGARPLSATLRRVPSKGWVRDKGRRAA